MVLDGGKVVNLFLGRKKGLLLFPIFPVFPDGLLLGNKSDNFDFGLNLLLDLPPGAAGGLQLAVLAALELALLRLRLVVLPLQLRLRPLEPLEAVLQLAGALGLTIRVTHRLLRAPLFGL